MGERGWRRERGEAEGGGGEDEQGGGGSGEGEEGQKNMDDVERIRRNYIQ